MPLGVDPDWAKVAVDVGQFLLLGAVGLHQWVIARDRVRTEQISALEADVDGKLDDHASRLDHIEERVQHLPGHALCASHMERLSRLEERFSHTPGRADLEKVYRTINPLRESVAALRSDMAAMREALTEIRRGVSVLTDALMRHNDRSGGG